ncbi:beta-lactamase-like protein [Leptospira santarosai str. CBC1531]|nr:beta-lactamase-like protein [Leptospira santarosai str. CBC1531]
MIHSMTKTFTAAAILRLADKGNCLSTTLRVNIYRILPYDERVTIRN